ncbi:MAG: PTS sugar transporter subunit IIB [Endomicrobia bacterium]|nr:PTS sugar transporter subunit IIB [Endomicrobiia bacterium]
MSYIIRIDDRLVHGQVVEGWIKPLSIDSIVVCSDVVYCDTMAKTLFEISTPKHIKLTCLSINLTAESLVKGEYRDTNTLILIASLKDLHNLVLQVRQKEPEYQFPSINIGGIRHTQGRKQIYKALYLDEENYNILKTLCNIGIKMEYYVLPYDERIILNEKLQEIEKIVYQK